MRAKIIAVDFDGTLCENRYPEIGEPYPMVISTLRFLKLMGCKLILWTCREGAELEQAVLWCGRHGLFFDKINENIPDVVERWGTNSRKVFANVYFDDRSLNPLEVNAPGASLVDLFKEDYPNET